MPNDLESITKELNQNLRQSISMASSISRSASKTPSPESLVISELKKQVDFLMESGKSSSKYSHASIILSSLSLLIAALTFIFSFVVQL